MLTALLESMGSALCAFDAEGVVTHWNGEAERVLGWSAREAVGRRGLAGWAVRGEDADDIMRRLLAVSRGGGTQVHEFALLTRGGGRVLVRAQTAALRTPDGGPAGAYCAFSAVHAQIGLERSIALSEALFGDPAWGVALIDADLRPAIVNDYAAHAFAAHRDAVLGRPLGELLATGVEELEAALHHVLSEGAPPAPFDLWVTLRADPESVRRCWRSGFVRLGTPLGDEPVPLGVGWVFSDITREKAAEQEASRLRFRVRQLRRAANVAADCEEPSDAAAAFVDYALAGFADHALLDTVGAGGRLVRVAATPEGPGPCMPAASAGVPVGYDDGHPAVQALERTGSVRASALPPDRAVALRWPRGTRSALCVVLRGRGRSIGVVTFLRGRERPPFDREDVAHAEDVAARIAAVLDHG